MPPELTKPIEAATPEHEIRLNASALLAQAEGGHRPPPVAMGAEAFHGDLGEFIRGVAPYTEADPAAILAHALVYAGSVVGRSPYFEVEHTRHGLNEFIVVVGPTASGRKGTARDLVHGLFSDIDEKWVKNCTSPSVSTGEGLIHAIRDPQPANSPDDPGDPGVSDKRLHVIDSEFASTLKVLKREGNTLSPILRNAWDGTPLRTLTRSKPIRVAEPHISIVGHVTQHELVHSLGRLDASNGLANRFLWVVVRRSKVLPEGGRPPPELLTTFRAKLAERIRRGQTLGRIDRDSAAKALWASVYEQLTTDRPGLLGGILARGAPHVCRLSTLYALLDGRTEVAREHLEAALAFWNYCERSAEYIFGDALGDPLADDILLELRRRPEGMSRTEIRDYLGKHTSGGDITRALDHLRRENLAYSYSIDTGGRPAEQWHVTTSAAPEAASLPSLLSL